MNPLPRILVIEDELPMRTALQDCLERQGYRVLVAVDGETGLEKAIHEKPDLVLLDVMMPRMFGGEVAARLREDEALKSVVIVFLTASVKRQRVEDHGGVVSGFPMLAKPVSVQEVISCIERNIPR